MRGNHTVEKGSPWGLAFLWGGLAFLVVLVLELVGVWERSSLFLMEGMTEAGFSLVSLTDALMGVLLVFPVAILMAWVLVAGPSGQRQLMVWLSALVLSGLWSAVAGVWGSFFNPLPLMLGVFLVGMIVFAREGVGVAVVEEEFGGDLDEELVEDLDEGKVISLDEGKDDFSRRHKDTKG